MAKSPKFDDAASAALHNRLAKRIVPMIANEPIAAGGSMSDVFLLCESVLVGVMLECADPGNDIKILDLVVGRVKQRLAEIRLTDLDAEGRG